MSLGNQFGQRARDLVARGSVTLALAMAQETGIVRELCQASQPMTSQAIATEAQLKERYVREILGALTSSGLVQLTPETAISDGVAALYFVPPDHRHALHKAACDSLIVSASARRFARVKDCVFLNGPYGVVYTANDLFGQTDAVGEGSNYTLLKLILDNTPGLQESLDKGIEVAEFGCGTGSLLVLFASRFPKSHFTATDVSEEAVAVARLKAKDLANIECRLQSVCQPPDDCKERFDWILTVNVIHDLPHPDAGLRGISKMLKPGGRYSLLDQCVSSRLEDNVGDTGAMFLYGVSTFLCLPESYETPDVTPLGACWGEQRARDMLHDAGFHVHSVTKTDVLGATALFACTK